MKHSSVRRLLMFLTLLMAFSIGSVLGARPEPEPQPTPSCNTPCNGSCEIYYVGCMSGCNHFCSDYTCMQFQCYVGCTNTLGKGCPGFGRCAACCPPC